MPVGTHSRGLLLAALVVSFSAQAQTELFANPGLENGLAGGWAVCGDASLADAQAAGTTARMVHTGRYAVRIGTDGSNTGCGTSIFDPISALYRTVTVPASAAALTISFWYSRVGNPGLKMSVKFEEVGGFAFVLLPQIDPGNLPGWHHYRAVLLPEDVATLRGRAFEFQLVPDLFSSGDGIPPNEPGPGFYVDDIRLVTGEERTTASPLPPGLAANGSAPIVYVDGTLGGVARMEADGSARRLLAGQPDIALSPTWASGGDRVAVLQPNFVPAGGGGIETVPAQITAVIVVPVAGGPPVEVFRTSGIPGRYPTNPTPSDPERPALDVVIRSVDWSPDDSRMVLGVCSSERYFNGSRSDEICWDPIIDVVTGAEVGRIEPAFRAKWSSRDEIVFEETAGLNTRPNGIWTVAGTPLGTPDLTIEAYEDDLFGLTAYTDTWATWTPDGVQFATVRDVDGGQPVEDPVFSFYSSNHEIVLSNRDGTYVRTLLLADHGPAPTGLTWSPDGQFLLYSLSRGNSADIWWLRASDGATGVLVADAIAANWSAVAPPPPTASERDRQEASPRLAVFPSPSRGPVTVALDLAAPALVRLSVVDALGREVAVVLDESRPAGPVRASARLDLPAGAYVVTATLDGAPLPAHPFVVVR